jgi:hypothetical protein
MPQDFENCVKNGGRVVTKSLKKNKYIHICYDKKGNSYSGEVMTKKTDKKKSKANFDKKISDAKALVRSLEGLKKYFNENFHD